MSARNASRQDQDRLLQDSNRKGQYSNRKFDFLGYTFLPILAINPKQNKVFVGILPKVSIAALKSMRQAVRALNLRRRTYTDLTDIAKMLNPLLMGWLNYYEQYTSSALHPFWRYINAQLVAWVMRKYMGADCSATSNSTHFWEVPNSLYQHARPLTRL